MPFSSRRILFLAALLCCALGAVRLFLVEQGPGAHGEHRLSANDGDAEAESSDGGQGVDVSKKLSEPDAEEMERLGDQYIRQGNMNMAFVYYDKAVRMDPKRSSAHYKMGRLYLSKGMNDEARLSSRPS